MQYQHRQAARRERPVVAARRLQLGRRRQAQHAGPRRHRRLHRPAGLRLDLEPDRQHRRADRLRRRSTNTHRPSRSTRPRTLQADQRDRRAGRQLRARASPTRTSSSRRSWRTNIARRPAPAVGPRRHRRVHLQQGRQRHLLHQRQPAGGADDVHRRRPAAALDRHVVHRGNADACVTRINNAPGNQVTNAIVLKNQNDGRSWNFAGSVHEEPAGRPQRARPPTATASRRHCRSRLDRRRLVRPATRTPATRTTRGWRYSASSPGHRFVHQRHLHEAVLQLRRDERLGVLGDAHQRQHQLHVLRRHERRTAPATT